MIFKKLSKYLFGFPWNGWISEWNYWFWITVPFNEIGSGPFHSCHQNLSSFAFPLFLCRGFGRNQRGDLNKIVEKNYIYIDHDVILTLFPDLNYSFTMGSLSAWKSLKIVYVFFWVFPRFFFHSILVKQIFLNAI